MFFNSDVYPPGQEIEKTAKTSFIVLEIEPSFGDRFMIRVTIHKAVTVSETESLSRLYNQQKKRKGYLFCANPQISKSYLVMIWETIIRNIFPID